ncbi:efflux RND transporter periplasmic adaptor subunit [Treponema sp.]|uniref:efflux RND transporter periplasmic adaptor subunit n=1 Tax=Treponema sp. TaxID=166 RepID=UPI0025DCE139|nr:efflux RND transporter periplasmic adaptor subunit [Treponema sp.]MCR5217972.1 efflux RND transporter periplasmic adaptor subunit [Treponema sp.]
MKKNSISKSALFTTAVILSCFGLSSCSKKAAAANDEKNEITYAVNAYKIKPGNLDNYLEFGGDVDSVNAVDVLPDVNGKISSIKVNIGDMVKKDQIICYVDASRPGYVYSESPVKAPIAGRLTSFAPTVGTMVAPSMSIAKISNTDDLEIKVNVPERFISRVSKGQKAVLTFDSYPAEEFSATVFEVSPVLDTTSRTEQIKLRITEKSSLIKVGMYARVRLITDSIRNAIVVPESSIVTRDGIPYAFILDTEKSNDKSKYVKMVSIKKGITVDNNTEITEGLSADDIIIVKGQTLLNDGVSVNILSTVNGE